MSDEQKTEVVAETPAEPTEAQKITAQYHQACAEYGDAQYRMKSLQKFLDDAEKRLAVLQAVFERLAPK